MNEDDLKKLDDESVKKIADAVANKMMSRELHAAARLLLSKGFHVVHDGVTPFHALPFVTPVDPAELKNPLFFNERGADRITLDSPSRKRLEILHVLAEEIRGRNIPGALAELGVFKGTFAAHIRRDLPDRDFYLFDTFSGFSREEVEREFADNPEAQGFAPLLDAFKNTSVEAVLNSIGDVARCIVKKGLFRDTKGTVDDVFAFVSIDTDFYQSILEGLEFFYPRLSPGGYIMVHDYGSATLTGSKKAVREFCAAHGVPYMPAVEGSAVLGSV